MSGINTVAASSRQKESQHSHQKGRRGSTDSGPAKLTKERHTKRDKEKRQSENYLNSMKPKHRLSSAWAVDLSSDEQDNVMELYKQALLDDHKTKLSETYPKEYSKIYSYEMDFDEHEYDNNQEHPITSSTKKTKFKKRKKKAKNPHPTGTSKKLSTFPDSKSSHSPSDNGRISAHYNNDNDYEGDDEYQDDVTETDYYSIPPKKQSIINQGTEGNSPRTSSPYRQEFNDNPNDMYQAVQDKSQGYIYPDGGDMHDDSNFMPKDPSNMTNDYMRVPDEPDTAYQEWDDRASDPQNMYREGTLEDDNRMYCESGDIPDEPSTRYNDSACQPDFYRDECLDPKLKYEDSSLTYHPPNDEMLYGKLSCRYCRCDQKYSPRYDILPCNRSKGNNLLWTDQYFEPLNYHDLCNERRTDSPSDVFRNSKPISPQSHTRHCKNYKERAYETSCCYNDRLDAVNGNDNLFIDRDKVRRGDLFKKHAKMCTSPACDVPHCSRGHFKQKIDEERGHKNNSKHSNVGYHAPYLRAPAQGYKVVKPIEETGSERYWNNRYDAYCSCRSYPDKCHAHVMHSSGENWSNDPPQQNQPRENQYKTYKTYPPSYQIKSDQNHPGATYSMYEKPPTDYIQNVVRTPYSSQPYTSNHERLPNNPTSYADSIWEDNVYYPPVHVNTDYYQCTPQNLQEQFHVQEETWAPAPDLDPYFKDGCLPETQGSSYGCTCQETVGNGGNGVQPTDGSNCKVWNLDGCNTWNYGELDTTQSSKDSPYRHETNQTSQRPADCPKEKKQSKMFKFILDARHKTVTCCLLPETSTR